MNRAKCERCKKPGVVCYCHTIVQVVNVWPVHILHHPREARHAIGTARIAQLSLASCSVDCAVAFDEANTVWNGDDRSLLIYPDKDAKPVEDFLTESPRPLIFLDASWKKSRRMLYESPKLDSLQKVSVNAQSVSRYLIRKEPRPGCLSTLEAIVHTLSILERCTDKYRPLLDTMDYMIKRQIDYMGKDLFENNYRK